MTTETEMKPIASVEAPDGGRCAVESLLGVRDDDLITVCDRCLCATCWQGAFLCDESYAAGIVKKPRAELIALGREHPSHLRTDEEIARDACA